MSSVQPGGKGPGSQRSGGPARRQPASAKRPPAQGQRQAQRQPGGGGKRPPGKPGSGGRPGAEGKASAPRQNMRVTAAPPRRYSPSTIAFASIGVVVVVVVALVIVKVSTGGNKGNTSGQAPTVTVATPQLVSEITSVPQSVIDSVGTGAGNTAPSVVSNQPPLTSGGKPEVLFIGAEFCPYCAAERWAVAMAMSHFGTFTGLKETFSSPWDANPDTATLSFFGSSFTSTSIDFTAVEHESNDTNGAGTRHILQPLTTQQQNLWVKYSQQFGIQTGYPFLDIGNKVFVTGPSYNGDGTLLGGLSQSEIAAKFTNPNDPVTQAVVGTANYLTAAVCSLTGQQPTPLCTSSGVHKAATALHLG